MKGEALFEVCDTLDDLYSSIKLWRWNLMSKSYFHLGKLEMAIDSIDKHKQLRPAADK